MKGGIHYQCRNQNFTDPRLGNPANYILARMADDSNKPNTHQLNTHNMISRWLFIEGSITTRAPQEKLFQHAIK